MRYVPDINETVDETLQDVNMDAHSMLMSTFKMRMLRNGIKILGLLQTATVVLSRIKNVEVSSSNIDVEFVDNDYDLAEQDYKLGKF